MNFKKALITSFISLVNICLFADITKALTPGEKVQSNSEKTPINAEYQDSKTDALEQITNVSQLSDVSQKDWAYESLRSLIERYNCIVGYPNQPYQGNKSLSRYEFAAGLHTCLEGISKLLVHGVDNVVKKEDLETIKKLQTEFSSELASLGIKVDKLQVSVSNLEEHQFSLTTKLTGSAWFNLTNAFTTRDVQYEALPNTAAVERFSGGRNAINGKPIVNKIGDTQTTLSGLAWLTLNTSFTGRDKLVIQLAAGNGISPVNQFTSAGFFNSYGVPYTDQTAGQINGKTDVVIQDLAYTFPVNNSLNLTVGPRINWFNYFDSNRFTYFMTGAGSYVSGASTQSNAAFWGAGALMEGNINPKLRFAVAYLGENIPYLSSEFGFNTASNPNFGLFGGTNTTTAELTYNPTEKLAVHLRYNYSRLQGYGGQVGGGNYVPLPYGYLDAGSGFSVYDPITKTITSGGLDYAYAHTFALNFDALITPKFGIFGRYSYGNTTLKPINQAVNTQSFQVGLGFPDLGKKGALGVVNLVMPMDIVKGKQFFVSGGGNGGTMYELEASYYYPFNDNLAIVPSFYTVFNANNFDGNRTIYVFNIRTQFSF